MTTRSMKSKTQRFYVTPLKTDPKTGVVSGGKKYPLYEAMTNYPVRVYKSDKRKAIQGDPGECMVALGGKRDHSVIDIFIGAGKDAYVVFQATEDRPDHAVHYTIPAATRRIVDAFDSKRSATSAIITLNKPTEGRTMDARKTLNSKRRKRVKEAAVKGEDIVKHRKPGVPRIMRLGVVHRPRANIVTEQVSV